MSRTIAAPNTGTQANPNNKRNSIIKNCTPFTDCISETNNTPKDNAKDIDIITSMYNFI